MVHVNSNLKRTINEFNIFSSFAFFLSADSFSSALLVRVLIRIRIRRRMIFFKSFITKRRISKQLSPGYPSYVVGGLGGHPRGSAWLGGGSARGCQPRGSARGVQPGGFSPGGSAWINLSPFIYLFWKSSNINFENWSTCDLQGPAQF